MKKIPLITMLENNKGTISSALSKKLAKEVLERNTDILIEALELVAYDPKNRKSKNIRAGAAKIVEMVAEEKPELVAQHLDKLLPALNMPEPQTRWMVIHTFGLCATKNPDAAVSVINFADSFIKERAGICLSAASEKYLGYVGELSVTYAEKAFAILEQALQKAPDSEVDWILEAFYKLADNLDAEKRTMVAVYAKIYLKSPKKATIKRAENILKKMDK